MEVITTLEECLKTELRASSSSIRLGEIDEAFTNHEKYVQESFSLKYGLIHPPEEVVERVLKDFYKNQGYTEVPHEFHPSTPKDLSDNLRSLNRRNGTKNYGFVKDNSSFKVSTTPISDGLLVSVVF